MPRPDQAKFDLFAKTFEPLDEFLESFSREYDFQVQTNLNRQPCRVLTKGENPQYLIDLSYDSYWVETEFSADLTFSVTLIAYYTPPSSDEFILKTSIALAHESPFSLLRIDLKSYLEQAVKIINLWTPDFIIRNGERLVNLKKKYYTE